MFSVGDVVVVKNYRLARIHNKWQNYIGVITEHLFDDAYQIRFYNESHHYRAIMGEGLEYI